MAGYKLATYQTSDGPRAGLVIDDKVFDAAKLTGKPDYATRARHPQRLAGGAGRPQEGGRGGGKKPGEAAAARRAPSCWRRCSGPIGDLLRRRRTMPTTPPKWPAA